MSGLSRTEKGERCGQSPQEGLITANECEGSSINYFFWYNNELTNEEERQDANCSD